LTGLLIGLVFLGDRWDGREKRSGFIECMRLEGPGVRIGRGSYEERVSTDNDDLKVPAHQGIAEIDGWSQRALVRLLVHLGPRTEPERVVWIQDRVVHGMPFVGGSRIDETAGRPGYGADGMIVQDVQCAYPLGSYAPSGVYSMVRLQRKLGTESDH
jgi:hypothetical protein